MHQPRDPNRTGHYDEVGLVLQGGGALGAYQAGVYEALAGSRYQPDWVAGISIGAINSAIIVGNPPERRVERLREFWELVSGHVNWSVDPVGDQMRTWLNQLSAGVSLTLGQPGFFKPRVPPPWAWPDGAPAATSFYDTGPLRETLLRLVDFDLINEGKVRLSVGAVNVRSGNFFYFDNRYQPIGPEHIMASGALPPGFPAVNVDGEWYWDGGLVSNTPLTYMLAETRSRGSLLFQVDLFSARGPLPRSLPDVAERQKDIQFSSRTRANTDMFERVHELRCAISELVEMLPEEQRNTPRVEELRELGSRRSVNIVHLIYRQKVWERESKDYEFSRNSMTEHWKTGLTVTRRALRHPEWLTPPGPFEGVKVHDALQDALD